MERKWGILEDAKRVGATSLSAVVLFLASYAMLGAYLHCHADFAAHPDCAACEFEDTSAGDKTDVYAIPRPGFRYVSPDSEDVIRIPLIVTPADCTRAPPS